ncbi:MAG: DUF2252 family protein [Bacteroidetes bacterium]|jgi:uncharacterized protein (DUF2252 family)|nr:DUF2252 family protein [Bacteroidota bacterium]
MNSVYERIVAFNKDRLPDMVKLKFAGMAENVYRFYRGTCHLFYEDFCKAEHIPESPLTWICGDLHMENYGSYKGDNRLVYFDLNDFDESVLAPCLWEISRMVTSIFIAFDNIGIKAEKATKMAEAYLKTYSARLATGKALSIDPRIASGIVCTFLTKAEERKQKDLVKKLTIQKKHRLCLVTDDRHFSIDDKSYKKELTDFIDHWLESSAVKDYNYKVVDSAFRIAGTGSIGVKRYMFLLESKKNGKYLLVDMKQAKPSSVQPYLSVKQPEWQNEATRVMQVKQRMQNVSPALLGTGVFKGDSYVIQEMQPTEDRINFEMIKNRYDDIRLVTEDMALLTASAQLRSTGRQGSAIADKLIEFGYSNDWHEAILNYAKKYAGQVKQDYEQYVSDYKAAQNAPKVSKRLIEK